MPENVYVLTRVEKGIAGAAAAVLLTGLIGTSYADTPPAPPAPVALTAAQPSPTPTPQPSPRLVGPPAPKRVVRKKAAPAPQRPVPPAVPQAGCPVPKRPGKPYTPKPLKAPTVPDAALPLALPSTAKATSIAAVSGKGIWVTNWKNDRVDVPGIVARAKRAGLHNIWVRTGGSKQGYYGDQVLPRLVPAAHKAGLNVVAWDFPFLSDPVADAARAHRALATGIDAFAPDIETSA